MKPIAAIKDIRILNTGGMLGGASNGDGGLGFGDGLAGQLLKLQAFRPVIDEILRQGGYKPGADPLMTLLDNATGAPVVNGVPAPSTPPQPTAAGAD